MNDRLPTCLTTNMTWVKLTEGRCLWNATVDEIRTLDDMNGILPYHSHGTLVRGGDSDSSLCCETQTSVNKTINTLGTVSNTPNVIVGNTLRPPSIPVTMWRRVPSTVEVKFIDYDGTLIKTVSIPYGGSLTNFPQLPDHSSLGFTNPRWSEALPSITKDITIEAIYDYKVKVMTSPQSTYLFVSVNGSATVSGTISLTLSTKSSEQLKLSTSTSAGLTYKFVAWTDGVTAMTRMVTPPKRETTYIANWN